MRMTVREWMTQRRVLVSTVKLFSFGKEREVDGVRKEKERLTAAEGLAEIQMKRKGLPALK